jgi:hypothetical protein
MSRVLIATIIALGAGAAFAAGVAGLSWLLAEPMTFEQTLVAGGVYAAIILVPILGVVLGKVQFIR